MSLKFTKPSSNSGDVRTPFLVPLCWWTTKSSVGRHVWRGRLWATSAPRIRVTRRSLIQLECTCVFFKTHHFDPFCPYTFSLLCCCRKPKKIIRCHHVCFPGNLSKGRWWLLYWSALRPHGHGGGRDDDDKVVKHRSWERAPRHFQNRANEFDWKKLGHFKGRNGSNS